MQNNDPPRSGSVVLSLNNKPAEKRSSTSCVPAGELFPGKILTIFQASPSPFIVGSPGNGRHRKDVLESTIISAVHLAQWAKL